MRLDHLVVAAEDLQAGVDWVEQRLDSRPVPGGRHEDMGTHNALLGLGDCYLEVIAVDPGARPPDRPRWFDLDAFHGAPRLVHWVARVDDISAVAAGCTEPLGGVVSARRGELRWRITVPADGHLPGGGVVPTLIEWDGPSAATKLPASGWSLASLAAGHPDPSTVRPALRSLGADLTVTRTDTPRLFATLKGPGRLVLLD